MRAQSVWCWNIFPSSVVVPAERLQSYCRQCCEQRTISFKTDADSGNNVPIRFVQNDNFVAAGRQGDFLLSESLNFVSDNVNTSNQGLDAPKFQCKN